MTTLRLLADSYFDGSLHHPAKDGPYLITIASGRIAAIEARAAAAPFDRRASFLMPGLVEAHAHLFLDGGDLDFDRRNAYLNASKDEMLKVAHENIARNAAGLWLFTELIDNAGDFFFISVIDEVGGTFA